MPVKLEHKTREYTEFKFPDPVFILLTYNDDFREGKCTLYKWQIETLLKYADDEVPKRMALCANNGSGKSQVIVAPCAIWSCMRYSQAQVVITSASGDQIDNQVCRALNNICRRINSKHGSEIWKINYRRYECVPTGSIIDLYATDDPGKAEGYHPVKHGGEFVIIVDEAKSVPDEIFMSIGRCTGFTRRLDVSSPGLPRGYFYREFTMPNDFIWKKRVTWLECPHIRENEAKEAMQLMGEAFYRSAFMAEFVGIEENVVILMDEVNKAAMLSDDEVITPIEYDGLRFAGVDLSAGGDETVVSIFDGCKQIGLECFKEQNALNIADKIINILNRYNVSGDNVNADDGGLGKPIIDILWEKGYNVNRVLNQSVSYNKLYANRGAEIWFNFARWIREGKTKLLNDTKLLTQLSSRRYTRAKITGKILLESKEEIRKKHGYSPDRADATVLAFADKPYSAVTQDNSNKKSGKTMAEVINEITIKQLYNAGDKWLMSRINRDRSALDLLHDRYGEDVVEDIIKSEISRLKL